VNIETHQQALYVKTPVNKLTHSYTHSHNCFTHRHTHTHTYTHTLSLSLSSTHRWLQDTYKPNSLPNFNQQNIDFVFCVPTFFLHALSTKRYHHGWYALCAAWQSLPLVVALLAAKATEGGSFTNTSFGENIGVFALFLALTFTVSCSLSLVFVVAAKRAIIGARTVGQHSWDTSSYCQRWQMFLCAEELRRSVGFGGRGILDFLRGSWYLVAYFRVMGAKIGRDACLYPNGGDPMMTEPELVTINDGACVDNASLIAHLNVKGQFSLNQLWLGELATMRSNTRLLSGETRFLVLHAPTRPLATTTCSRTTVRLCTGPH
jgi:hypothetical protein